jgi:hypothetical protein
VAEATLFCCHFHEEANVNGLLKSRKFWLLILDTLISSALFFVGKYADPDLADDVKFLIASLQPVFIAIIGGIAIEDAAAKRSGANFPIHTQ